MAAHPAGITGIASISGHGIQSARIIPDSSEHHPDKMRRTCVRLPGRSDAVRPAMSLLPRRADLTPALLLIARGQRRPH